MNRIGLTLLAGGALIVIAVVAAYFLLWDGSGEDAPVTARSGLQSPATEAGGQRPSAPAPGGAEDAASQAGQAEPDKVAERTEPQPQPSAADQAPTGTESVVAPAPAADPGAASTAPAEEAASPAPAPQPSAEPTVEAAPATTQQAALPQQAPQKSADPAPAAEPSTEAPAAAEAPSAKPQIQVEQRAALPEPTGQAEPAPALPSPPSFDVVRVEPSGETVIAGRAEPGSEVTVLDGETEVGSVRADGNGTWVLIVERPLAPGSHHLGLRSESADGTTLESANVVIVAIPHPPKPVAEAPAAPETAGEPAPGTTAEATAKATPGTASETAPETAGAVEKPAVPTPLAVLAPREGQGPSRILQQPEGEGIKDQDLVLSAVDYDAAGRVIISGSARPGAWVLIYLNNALLGQAQADAEGRWALGPGSEVVPGLHRLRVDQVDEQGSVAARIETPFSRAETLITLPEEQFVVVQPGNSLWRIARRSYGEGLRYSVIFQNNRDQIGDPDLIYPGQIFMVPEIN